MTKNAVSTLVSLSTLVAFAAVSGCAAPGESDRLESPGASPAGLSEGAAPGGESVGTSSEELSWGPLEVSFGDCNEVASVTPVPYANARAIVPAAFEIAGDGAIAPFVVRVGRCEVVRVGGGPPEAGTIAQLGVSVVSPDGTGDINVYTNWYYTTSARLALRLNVLGVPAQWAPRLDYDLESGTLDVDVRFPAHPRFSLAAAVVEPGPAAFPSSVNWWRQHGSKVTKMNSAIPGARLGVATTTLTTPPGGALAAVLGASTASFPFLDSFNRFADATMTVTKD